MKAIELKLRKLKNINVAKLHTALKDSPQTSTTSIFPATIMQFFGYTESEEKIKRLALRQWIIIIIEILLTFVAHIIFQKLKNHRINGLIVSRLPEEEEIPEDTPGPSDEEEEESHQSRLIMDDTVRVAVNTVVNWQGWSGVVCVVVGWLADSYCGFYLVALLNVLAHFTLISVIMIGNIVGQSKYAKEVEMMIFYFHIVVQSTNFCRMIYGLQGMKNFSRAPVKHFIFAMLWASERSTDAAQIAWLTAFLKPGTTSIICFCLCGGCLFFYVYFLSANETVPQERKAAARIWRNLLTVILKETPWVKQLVRSRFKVPDLDELITSKMKELGGTYLRLLPLIGYPFLMVGTLIYLSEGVLIFIHLPGFLHTFGALQCFQFVVLVSMLSGYLVVWPLLTRLKIPDLFTYKFLIGYLFGLSCLLFTILMLQQHGGYTHSVDEVAYVRVINLRETNISLRFHDPSLSQSPYEVAPLQSFVGELPTSESTLVPLSLQFDSNSKRFTTLVKVEPGKSSGYIVTEPPEVTRIEGYLPVRSSREPGKASLFVYNTFHHNRNAEIVLKGSNESMYHKRTDLPPHRLTQFSLPAGGYKVHVLNWNVKKHINVHAGGVYGMLLHANPVLRKLDSVVIVPNREMPCYAVLIGGLLYGVSLGLALVAVAQSTYVWAPKGLVGMTFGFFILEWNIVRWVSFAKLKPENVDISSSAVTVNSSAMLAGFFIIGFIVVKFKRFFN